MKNIQEKLPVNLRAWKQGGARRAGLKALVAHKSKQAACGRERITQEGEKHPLLTWSILASALSSVRVAVVKLSRPTPCRSRMTVAATMGLPASRVQAGMSCLWKRSQV